MRNTAVSVFSAACACMLSCSLADAEMILSLTPATASSGTSMYVFGAPVTVTVPSSPNGDHGYGTYVSGVSGTGGGPSLGGSIWVTQNLGSSRDITFSWRTPTLNETFASIGGTPTDPPLNLAVGDFGLAADVVEISGFAPGETFVMFSTFSVPGGDAFDLQSNVADGSVHVATLNPVTGMWENAVDTNSSLDPNRVIDYQGSWEAAGKPMSVGSWGVDAANMVAWAVLNHNSQFTVAPEPSSVAMLIAGGAFCAVGAARRCRAGRRSA